MPVRTGPGSLSSLTPHAVETGECGSNLSKTARQGDPAGRRVETAAGSWLSPWRQMGPGEVAWDVDRYSLPHGEELAGC
jgi:hypothetical protein